LNFENEDAMDRDLARNTLEGIVALDRPVGQLMEIAKSLSDGAEKTALKDTCGELLRLQFDLIERITTAYPELRSIDKAASDT
jgi:hypothetical protein